jgi:hypothetical protein
MALANLEQELDNSTRLCTRHLELWTKLKQLAITDEHIYAQVHLGCLTCRATFKKRSHEALGIQAFEILVFEFAVVNE